MSSLIFNRDKDKFCARFTFYDFYLADIKKKKEKEVSTYDYCGVLMNQFQATSILQRFSRCEEFINSNVIRLILTILNCAVSCWIVF